MAFELARVNHLFITYSGKIVRQELITKKIGPWPPHASAPGSGGFFSRSQASVIYPLEIASSHTYFLK